MQNRQGEADNMKVLFNLMTGALHGVPCALLYNESEKDESDAPLLNSDLRVSHSMLWVRHQTNTHTHKQNFS